jgi:hypothetical protein
MGDHPFVAMIAAAIQGQEAQLKIKIVLVVAIAALIAAFGAKAAWKWQGGEGKANTPYKVAGWSWGDGAAQGTSD